jgi:hypothetical protein
MSTSCNHIVDDFIAWDHVNGLFIPRYQLSYEVWRDAIRRHPFTNKHFILVLIQKIAESAHLLEYPHTIHNWQLLSVYCQKMLVNKEF